jgi:hypothetical protein
MANVFQKIFATVGFGSGGRIPIRSNIMNFGHTGSGYSKIGSASARFQNDRQSALLGNYSPSNRISGWLSRVAELKGYENIDTCKMAVSLFEDYTNNFLNTSAAQVITILDEEGNEDEQKTLRINDILIRDIKIFDFIRDHLRESIYYGCYYSLLRTKRDDKGHLRFFPYELFDPVSVIVRKNMDPKTNEIVDEYIAMGEDGEAYIIPDDECFYLGSPNMRLKNDIKESDKSGFVNYQNPYNKKEKGLKFGKNENRAKVMLTESYTAGEPIFYSNILKVKELVVKELLVSLLTLRDLTTPSILALMFDKGVPIESAQELCTRVQRMLSSYNDLSSFLSSQFDVTSLIENILSQNIKVIPDYNATLQNKGLINTDKLSDKLMEIMQTLDQTRQQVLSTIGVPASMIDGSLGANKWQILQTSERAASKTLAIITGLKESIKSLVRTIYKVIYNETIDPDLIRIHAFSKNTVEYNNSMNTMENVSALTSGISNILMQALQTLDQSFPLLEPKAYIGYIRNTIKDIDPEAVDLITDETLEQYIQFANEKYQAQRQQLGLE